MPAGNLIGRYEGASSALPVLMIGSHLDTVPDAGKYDGVLGVVLGIAAVEALGGRRLPFGIDVIAFSEEEGIRYRAPFLGSRAVCGQFDRELLDRSDRAGRFDGRRRSARSGSIRNESPRRPIPPAASAAIWKFTSSKGRSSRVASAPVGVVAGNRRARAGSGRTFRGQAGHAGTLPMQGRRDALAAAAELVLEVERLAQEVPELRATVGS